LGSAGDSPFQKKKVRICEFGLFSGGRLDSLCPTPLGRLQLKNKMKKVKLRKTGPDRMRIAQMGANEEKTGKREVEGFDRMNRINGIECGSLESLCCPRWIASTSGAAGQTQSN
jgi:hypothetical protein